MLIDLDILPGKVKKPGKKFKKYIVKKV